MQNTSTGIEPPRIYPTFRYNDVARMIEWLEKVFGFTVRAKYAENGKIGHAELAFGSSMIMLGDAKTDVYGQMVGTSGDPGGKSLYIAVDDVDALFARAKAAGAEILEEPTDRHWGSRDFICRDPEGNVWSLGTYWPKAHERAQ